MIKCLLVLIIMIAKNCDADSNCNNINENSPLIHNLATQTPYFPPNVTHYHIPNCRPTKAWMAIRHGTCYPPTYISKTYSFVETLRDKITKTEKICQSNYELIKNWNMKPFVPHHLTMQGWRDQISLAKRWQLRYPNIFEKVYSPETFKFGHSTTERTRDSCQAFTEGLFGENENYNNIQRVTNDMLIAPFMNCSKYMQNFDAVLDSLSLNDFTISKEFKQVKESVKNKLGLFGPKEFPTIDIMAIFYACSYHQSANLGSLSPWCSAFNLTEIKVLEYLFDLQNYYSASYGFMKTSQKLPCAAIWDMYKILNDSTSSTKLTAYFTHSYMLELIMTAFGLNHDKLPLFETNYNQQQNRKFKTNEFLPFATNFAAIKHECSDNEPAKILFMWNEKPLPMSWCKDGAICTLNEIENLYRSSTMNKCPCDICGEIFAQKSMERLPQSLFIWQEKTCLHINSLTDQSSSMGFNGSYTYS